MTLFPREQVVGIFRGFSEGGMEFHADLVLPYRNEFQNSPMHGQFLLVQLENENEGVLGRITSLSSEGRLASGMGEDYGLRAVAEDREIPEDLREQYLKYRVNIRVLGVLRQSGGQLVFAPSHRRLPHVGSKVAFLSDDILRWVAGHDDVQGAELGFLALGEYIFSGGDRRLDVLDWMQIRQPAVIPRFEIKHLVSRRTFVFARAGFGKSNLNKLLFSLLYRDETPTVEKRGGRRVPVGTVIFDPDGEYFWPDDKNRPGLCDVPELADKLVVFTNRQAPSAYYGSFVAGSIKIDIRRLRPADVISIALSPEKQDQQNVRKLKGLNDEAWRRLVDEIYVNGNGADSQMIRQLLKLEDNQCCWSTIVSDLTVQRFCPYEKGRDRFEQSRADAVEGPESGAPGRTQHEGGRGHLEPVDPSCKQVAGSLPATWRGGFGPREPWAEAGKRPGRTNDNPHPRSGARPPGRYQRLASH